MLPAGQSWQRSTEESNSPVGPEVQWQSYIASGSQGKKTGETSRLGAESGTVRTRGGTIIFIRCGPTVVQLT